MDKDSQIQEKELKNDIIEGRNAVIEALRAGRAIDKIFIAKGDVDKTLGHIASKARDKGIVVVEADRRKLDFMSQTHAHQGVVAMVAAHAYATVDEILENAKSRGEAPLIVLCDDLSDPHNLGAVIRSACCAGAHGVIIPRRNAATLNTTAVKASAGASEYMPVCRVSNIAQTVDELKKKNIWVYAAEADGTDFRKTDLTGGIALIFGSEGDGVSRLVREKCDGVVSIPMYGEINSLNISAAAAVIMFGASSQRFQ